MFPRQMVGEGGPDGRLVDNDDDNVNKYNSITFDNDTDGRCTGSLDARVQRTTVE